MSQYASEWVQHKRPGFPKDISKNDNISVMLRTGDIQDGVAKDFNWNIRFHPDDILEYCIYDEDLDYE